MEINCISSPLSQAGGQRSGVGLVSPGHRGGGGGGGGGWFPRATSTPPPRPSS